MRLGLALAGFGAVGRRLVELLAERSRRWERRYGVRLELVAVSSSSHTLTGRFDLSALALHAASGRPLGEFPGAVAAPAAPPLVESGAGVLVDATPTDLHTGEPGLSLLAAALERGMHGVALAKGPLVRGFGRLRELARCHRVGFRFSGATAAALPTVDAAEFALAGAELGAFRGILNGTTNFMLTQMEESDLDYAAALAEAQRRGIAEADPALDVTGLDTAAKTCILANALLEADLTLEDIATSGIAGLDRGQLLAARREGQVLKLVGAARRGTGGVEARVAVEAVPAASLLGQVRGTTKAIVYYTDTMGELALVGGASDPLGAAAAALKDVLNLARRPR